VVETEGGYFILEFRKVKYRINKVIELISLPVKTVG
jgi:hypothetical protein